MYFGKIVFLMIRHVLNVINAGYNILYLAECPSCGDIYPSYSLSLFRIVFRILPSSFLLSIMWLVHVSTEPIICSNIFINIELRSPFEQNLLTLCCQ